MNKIDEILANITMPLVSEEHRRVRHAKSQLKVEILKGKVLVNHRWGKDTTTELHGFKQVIRAEDTIEAIPVTYINELFNVKEK